MHQNQFSFFDFSDTSASSKDSRASRQTWDSDFLARPKSPPQSPPLAHHIAKEMDHSFQFDYDTFYKGYLTEKELIASTEGSSSTSGSSDLCLVKRKEVAAPEPSLLKSRQQQILFIFITCIAQFLSLSALNQTVSPVLILAEDFGVEDYGKLSWFSASYSMSVGTFILPAGRLGDMYGHKQIYTIGWLWFGIWSIITGFSYTSNHIMFSVCRALQGIGPALLVPNAVALIGRNLPVGKQRMIGFACFGACGPLGATFGAVFSALIAQLFWWPWMFWILAIACLIVMVLAYIILPDEKNEPVRPGTNARPPRFDYWGTITGVTGLVLINTALNQAPLVLWKTAYVGAVLGAGCLLMVAFILVELYATDDPLIPIRGLGKDAIFALACIATGWASHGIWAYYLYLFLEHLRGYSALLTSAQTSPVAITGVLFAFSTVWLIQRFGIAQVMFMAMTFFMVGVLLLATMPIDQTYWAQTFVSILIMPGAMALSYPTANMLLSSALPKEKQGVAASLVSTLVNYSISCGLGIAGTIDRYVIRDHARASRAQSGYVRRPPPLSEVTPELSASRLVGFRASFWFAVAFSALGMVIAAAFILVTEKRKRVQRRAAEVQA